MVNFTAVFLSSERVTGVVAGGGLSYNDCREIFRHQVEKVSENQLTGNIRPKYFKYWKYFSRNIY